MSQLRTLLARRNGVLLMGILNRTPDSFSDGGSFIEDGAAARRIDAVVAEGAAILDVGAESTRPGASPIPPATQLARLGDVISRATHQGILVSVDTTSAEVAEKAIRDGAAIVNTVSLDSAAELGRLCAAHDAGLVLTHCRGSMTVGARAVVFADDAYGDVVADVAREWQAAAEQAFRSRAGQGGHRT